MPLLLELALLVPLVVFVALAIRTAGRRARLASLRAAWGRPSDRERDMAAISSYHRAIVAGDPRAPTLDDRTWIDLNLDDVFAVVDRTVSTVGQQQLYHRMRASPVGAHLDAFEALVTRFSDDAAAREAAQAALVRLSDKGGYELWSLAQPGMIPSRPWFVFFPIFAAGMASLMALSIVWPGLLLLVFAGLAVSVTLRMMVAGLDRLVLAPFRQLGPLLSAADTIARQPVPGAEPITGTLAADIGRLARLRRIAAWVSRDASASSFDFSGIFFEYLNLLLLIDANALFFGARELHARSADLLRVIEVVGDADAAVSVASYRAGTSGWTRPEFRAAGAPADLVDVRHPLVDHAVPNSITLGPPHGVIITGSNMSGKSTFLRTSGVTMVLAQTLHTCLASRYAAPVFAVRSCIGRSDDLLAGKSYYIVEVESVLSLVAASQTPTPHLFLFDELFRGTNAVERIAAGEAVLASLLEPSEAGPARHLVLAATHDQELVDLLSDTYAAYHFADTVSESGLTFTYRLEPGPATTRNAITLLRLSGAPNALVARALHRAAELDRHRRGGTNT